MKRNFVFGCVLIFFVLTIENEEELCVRVCFSFFFVLTIENGEKLCIRLLFSFFSF